MDMIKSLRNEVIADELGDKAGDLVEGVLSKVLSGGASAAEDKKEEEQEGGLNIGNLVSSVTGDKKDEDEGGLNVLKVAKGFLG